MIEFIQNLFSQIFGNNVILATIIISIIPIIELKGAIPFGMSVEIWGTHALNAWQSYLFSLIGTSVIVPLLALLYIPIIRWLKSTRVFKKLAEKIENRVNRRKERLNDSISSVYEKDKAKKSKKITFLKILGVFFLVVVPLPLTGVWTGTCVAVALGLSFPTICFTVILGNAVCGLLVTFFSDILGGKTMLIVLLAIIGIIIVAFSTKKVIDIIVTKHAKKEENNNYIVEDEPQSAEDQE